MFICLFLHQTTTRLSSTRTWTRCLSVYSYIKPQLAKPHSQTKSGVYLSIPTSNHNQKVFLHSRLEVFICLFLHQTTTRAYESIYNALVFICLFLHQTTTYKFVFIYLYWCLSVYSYIKPQLQRHNDNKHIRCLSVYSYIKPQLA